MSKIKDSFFGGAEKKAGRKQRKELKAAQERIEVATKEAKGEATTLFG